MVVAATLVLLTASACASNGGAPAGSPVLATSAGASSGAAATQTTQTVAPPTKPSSGGATTSAAAPPSTVPIAALPPQPWTPVAPAQVDLSKVTTNPPDSVQTTDGGQVVVFGREMGGCQSLKARVTEQTATTVGILAITISSSTAGQMCPMLIREVQAAVRLSAPLGNRTIVFTTATLHS
jgi:hypothetical protein